MLIIERKEGESIERTLRRYKRKYRQTKIREELRRRKSFTKPSVRRRNEILDAIYREEKKQEMEA